MLRLRLLSLHTFRSHVYFLQLLCLSVALAAEAEGSEADGGSRATPAQMKTRLMDQPQAAAPEIKVSSDSPSTGPAAEVADDKAASFKEKVNRALGLNISSYTFLSDPEADIQVGHSSTVYIASAAQ